MQIIIDRPEIEQALLQFVENQGLSLRNATAQVEIAAKGEKMQARVTIVKEDTQPAGTLEQEFQE